jgi:ATP-dependent helicase/DNAse subunit B
MFEFEDVVPAVVIPSSGKKVSYSQYSMFLKCKYQWYLSYVKGLRKYENSIHTIFGTAMHEVLQEYVRLLYTDGAPVADSYDAIGEFTKKITQLLIESNKDKKVIDETLLPEFLKDGEDIIKWFTKQANL